MHRKRLAILVMFLTMFVLVGCNNETPSEAAVIAVNEFSEKNKVLEEKMLTLEEQNQAFQVMITELELENEELQEQVDIQTMRDDNLDELFALHEEQAAEIFSYFNEEQLNAFAEDQWQYRLSVSDVDIPVSGVLEVEADQIEISLSQQQPEMSLLPSEILNKVK